MTEPAGTTELPRFVTVPIVRPEDVIADVAAVCVRLTTFGTVTSEGPVEMVSATAVLTTTSLPAEGF